MKESIADQRDRKEGGSGGLNSLTANCGQRREMQGSKGLGVWQEGVIPVFNHDVCDRNATREHTEEAYRVQATVEELKKGSNSQDQPDSKATNCPME